jgi:hypothetical protein
VTLAKKLTITLLRGSLPRGGEGDLDWRGGRLWAVVGAGVGLVTGPGAERETTGVAAEEEEEELWTVGT